MRWTLLKGANLEKLTINPDSCSSLHYVVPSQWGCSAVVWRLCRRRDRRHYVSSRIMSGAERVCEEGPDIQGPFIDVLHFELHSFGSIGW